MNDIRTIDLTRALPQRLKQDKTMLALASVIATELQKNADKARLAIIYARIDELDESILDILAYDLHVDWYNYSDPVTIKRAVIKSSIKIHKRLGTKFAVETALGDLHPGTYIEEWFEYGGNLHYFRVVLDVTHSRVVASYSRLIKEINFYKRLSSKLESLVYQATIKIEVTAEGKVFPYRTGLTGKYDAGTKPQRTIVGAIGNASIEINPEATAFGYQVKAAGTAPQRAVIGVLTESGINATIDAAGFQYTAGITGKYSAGEEPQRATVARLAKAEINVEAEGERYLYSVLPAGTVNAGTEPQRAVVGISRESGLAVELEGEEFRYTSRAAGTEPQRAKSGEVETSSIVQSVTAEGYTYKVKYCGTYRCK